MSASNRDDGLLEAGLAEVDELPRPSRRSLTLDAIVACCRLAVVRARTDNVIERRAQTFRDIVRGMEPATAVTMSIDGWARLGAVQGAIDRWTQATIPARPSDAPSADHMAAFTAAYGLSWQITHHAIEGVRCG